MRYLLIVLFAFLLGCSQNSNVASDAVIDATSNAAPQNGAEAEAPATRAFHPSAGSAEAASHDVSDNEGDKPLRKPADAQSGRTLADLLEQDEPTNPDAFGGINFGHPNHDDAKLAAAGIRKITGKYLTVYTDLPRGDVDSFPRVFEQAIPQWKDYFKLTDEQLANWRMTAYVIKDKDLFRRQEILHGGLPAFGNGWQQGFELWVYDQPSDYYRRHLLLHEGTHGVMNTLLRGAGPPWYMEGVAELLATHSWNGEKLILRTNPKSREEVPYWGRVKIVQDDYAANQGLRLDVILHYDSRAHQDVAAYGWCWAACQFLDSHPLSQTAFRAMQQQVRLPVDDFNRRFREQLADVWPKLEEQWLLYISELEYGSDVERLAIDYGEGIPPAATGTIVSVAADRGWQSSGLRVEAGKTYRLEAAGKFTIARESDGTPWPTEPGGVTLRYWKGKPLGILLAAVREKDPSQAETTTLIKPIEIGLRKQLKPTISGTLYFRFNDSPAELTDNAGDVKVKVTLE